MLASKGDHMIDEKKLDADEAWFFIRCMQDELERHRTAQRDADRKVNHTTDAVTKQFYSYGKIRHQEDINMIQKTINYLIRKWKI